MRRIDLLITQSRQSTENSEYSSDTGIQDTEFLQAANNAQERVQSLVLQVFPGQFEASAEIAAVADQEAYDLPIDTYLGTRVKMIEYSRTGLARDYFELEKGSARERVNGTGSTPLFYIRSGKTFLAQPKPASAGGTFRVTYTRSLPKLDKRRGSVSAVTLDTSALTITALTLDASSLVDEDREWMQDMEYICIVDRDGLIKMQGIPISAIDSTTGVVTVETFVYTSGETIDVGDYVVAGKYATTHSQLPEDIGERYVLESMNWKILKRDSSKDSVEQAQELKMMEDEIVNTFRDGDEEVSYVPILDGQFLD